MDIALSAADLKFRDQVRDFLGSHEHKPSEDYAKWRLDWFKLAAEQGGWDVPKWPQEFGGPGWTPTQHYVWERETARHNIPWDLPFGVNMVAPILMTYGSPEQQERFLPGIRDRSVNWCQGYSEPGAGSDLAALKTRAQLSDDRKHYLVNGQKMWTTLAHIAHWIFCLTRTSSAGKKQQGITFLLFPMEQEGVEVKPIITLGGAHSVNTVHLTNVQVPVENRVGEEGQGWTYAKGLLAHERTGLAGVSRSLVALEQLKEQAASIKRGNASLLDDPAFAMRLARLEIDLQALEFTELRSLSQAATGKEPGPESSIMKLKGTEIQQRLAHLSTLAAGPFVAPWGQVQTGPHFARQSTQSYLGSRAYTIYGGASEVQKDIIAKKVLGIRTQHSADQDTGES